MLLEAAFACFGESGMWMLMGTMFRNSSGACDRDGLVGVEHETSAWSGTGEEL